MRAPSRSGSSCDSSSAMRDAGRAGTAPSRCCSGRGTGPARPRRGPPGTRCAPRARPAGGRAWHLMHPQREPPQRIENGSSWSAGPLHPPRRCSACRVVARRLRQRGRYNAPRRSARILSRFGVALDCSSRCTVGSVRTSSTFGAEVRRCKRQGDVVEERLADSPAGAGLPHLPGRGHGHPDRCRRAARRRRRRAPGRPRRCGGSSAWPADRCRSNVGRGRCRRCASRRARGRRGTGGPGCGRHRTRPGRRTPQRACRCSAGTRRWPPRCTGRRPGSIVRSG